MAAAARKRWKTAEGEEQAAAVIGHLASGGGLDGLGLGETEEGRVNLRGLTLPPARITGRREIGDYRVESLGGMTRLEDVRLEGLGLSGAVLDNLWLTSVDVEDCRFDGAGWRDGRVWGCRLRRCSFVNASLRDLGLAPEHDGRRTVFEAVDFTEG